MDTSTMDPKDLLILGRRIEARDTLQGPRIGDFVRFRDGSLHRFTHDWDEHGLQTAPDMSGSFYLDRTGHASYSGGLDPCVPLEELEPTDEVLEGRFWFFHLDHAMAHNDVRVMVPCRVYRRK